MSNSKLSKLSELDLLNDKKALFHCIKNNIPILIIFPDTVSIWAVHKDHHDLVFGYKKLRANGYRTDYISFNKPSDRALYNKLEKKLIFEPVRLNNIKVLELGNNDIEVIIGFNKAEVSVFSNVYNKELEGEMELLKEISSEEYLCNESQSLHNTRNFTHLSAFKNRIWPSDESTFHFFSKRTTSFDESEDFWKQERAVPVTFNDLYVFSNDVTNLVSYGVNDIPKSSPFFIPEDCRKSSKLNQIAV